MTRKNNKYTNEQIKNSLEYKKRFGIRNASEKFNIPEGTINTWSHKYKDGFVEKKKQGRKQSLTPELELEILKKSSSAFLNREKIWKSKFIELNKHKYGVTNLCKVLFIYRKSYYTFDWNEFNKDLKDMEMIKKAIKKLEKRKE